MKSHLKIYLAITLASGAVCTASAQSLSTEVVVDRNIVPELRRVQRPLWPQAALVLGDTSRIDLEAATLTSVAPMEFERYTLSDDAGPLTPQPTPYRGYVGGGYFPVADFGISAGYRFYNKKNLKAGAFLQFDSQQTSPVDDDSKQFFTDGSLGAYCSWQPMDRSLFSASAKYNFLRQKTVVTDAQTINSGNIKADWTSRINRLSYGVRLSADMEHSGPFSPIETGKFSQQNIAGGAFAHIDAGKGYVGLDLDADFVHTSSPLAGSTVGFFDITPSYAFSTSKFSASIGVKLDVATGGEGSKFNVMPDIRMGFTPLNVLGISVNLSGGSVVNPFAALREITVCQVFDNPFGRSRLPIVADASLAIGPFSGFALEIFGGYAVADDWLMASAGSLSSFDPIDIKGWHAGAKISAEWRFIKGFVSADFAPSSFSHAWFARRDRAATVLEARVEASPLKRLTVSASYQFSCGRKAYSIFSEEPLSLGCISDLSAGATWRFTDSFSAFLRLENLLGRRYMLTPTAFSLKLHGLVGVGYKF